MSLTWVVNGWIELKRRRVQTCGRNGELLGATGEARPGGYGLGNASPCWRVTRPMRDFNAVSRCRQIKSDGQCIALLAG
jgi:hypothetical protein